MHTALKHLPSPLMGEDSCGGGSRASSPPSQPSPARGEGVFTPVHMDVHKRGKMLTFPCHGGRDVYPPVSLDGGGE